MSLKDVAIKAWACLGVAAQRLQHRTVLHHGIGFVHATGLQAGIGLYGLFVAVHGAQAVAQDAQGQRLHGVQRQAAARSRHGARRVAGTAARVGQVDPVQLVFRRGARGAAKGLCRTSPLATVGQGQALGPVRVAGPECGW
jgi:hypothetical protein